MSEFAPQLDEQAGSGSASGPLDDSTFWRAAEELRPYLKLVAERALGADLARRADPSSIVQEGLADAFANRGQLRSSDAAAIQAWLVAIVRNRGRKVRRFHLQDCRDIEREERLPEQAQRVLPAESTGPSSVAIRRERAARTAQVLEALSESHRTVIRLRNFERLQFDQIAKLMNRSNDAVRKLWTRAIEEFRKKWGPER